MVCDATCRSDGTSGPDLSAPSMLDEKSFAGLVSGTWAGTGISDLRASVTSQQKQIDSLVDRVAVLLSSMHSEATGRTSCFFFYFIVVRGKVSVAATYFDPTDLPISATRFNGQPSL